MDTWSATALNTAPDSIDHSDELAQQYGFEGGLIPGVTISAYLVHPLVERWGKAGSIEGTQIVASPLRCMTESCSAITTDLIDDSSAHNVGRSNGVVSANAEVGITNLLPPAQKLGKQAG